MFKKCSRCKKYLLLDSFGRNKSKSCGLQDRCKDCFNEDLRNWKKANPDKVKASTKKSAENHREEKRERLRKWQRNNPDKVFASRIKFAYGMTDVEFRDKVSKQENRCAICLNEFVKTPHIDHNHITGQNRDLLCRVCNLILGQVKEDAAILDRAAAYLRRHNG